MIPVEGHPNLYRDEDTGAIVNCDNLSYNHYIASVKKRSSQQLEIQKIKEDINEIKSLLKEILNGYK
jgi:hypothetical protein